MIYDNKTRLKAIDFHKSGLSIVKISKEMNKSTATISSWINDYSIKDIKTGRYSKEEIDFVLKNYKSLSVNEISKQINRKSRSVRKLTSKLNLKKTSNEIGRISSRTQNNLFNTNIWNKDRVIEVVDKTFENIGYIKYKDFCCLYSGFGAAFYKYIKVSWKSYLKQLLTPEKYEEYYMEDILNYMSISGEIHKSYIETLFDNLLFVLKKHNFIQDYSQQQKICETRKWTCDFVVVTNDNQKIFLEIDGMKEMRKISYNSCKNEKINYYINNKINYRIFYNVGQLLEKFKIEKTILLNEKNKIYNIKNIKIDEIKDIIKGDLILVKNKIEKVPTIKDYNLNKKNFSSFKIIKIFGSWRSTLDYCGFETSSNGPKVGFNWRRGVLKDKIGEICLLFEKGFSGSEIAQKFGVSKSAISFWKKRINKDFEEKK